MSRAIIENFKEQIRHYQHTLNEHNRHLILEVTTRINDEVNLSDCVIDAVSEYWVGHGFPEKVRDKLAAKIELRINAHFDSIKMQPYPAKILFSYGQNYSSGQNLTIENKEISKTDEIPNCEIDLMHSNILNVTISAPLASLRSFGSHIDYLNITPPYGLTIAVNDINLLGHFSKLDIGAIVAKNIKIDELESSAKKCNFFSFHSSKAERIEIQLINYPFLKCQYCEVGSLTVRVMGIAERIFIMSTIVEKLAIWNISPVGVVNSLFLNDLSVEKNLKVHSGLLNQILSFPLTLRNLTLEGLKIKKDTEFEFLNLIGIERLRINDVNVKGDLVFKNLHFENKPKKVTKQKKNSWFRMRNPAIPGNKNESNFGAQLLQHGLFLVSSSLGKTTFTNCRLPEKMFLYGIDFPEIKTTNAHLPKIVEILQPASDSIKDYYLNQMSAFQQLKKSYDSIGDKENSIYYRGAELNSRLNMLWRNRSNRYDDLGEILTLTLNQMTNRNSLSWMRGAKALCIYALISYALFLRSIGYHFEPTSEGLKIWWEQIDHIVAYLIPGVLSPGKRDLLRDFFSLTTKELTTSWTGLILFFNDVIAVPYLIYQIIAAFRKHGS